MILNSMLSDFILMMTVVVVTIIILDKILNK
jgi:hypothetical protein